MARARPTASISSMKTMQGAFSFAWRNRSLTRDAPTPTNISTKSEPEMEKKGTLASPATAFARRVLPVPGGPTSRAPLGILPPREVYLSGFLRKSTISITSSFAPYRPATSLKVTFTSPFSVSRAVDFPVLKGFMPPAPGPPTPRFIPRKIITQNSTRRRSGKIIWKMSPQMCSSFVMTTLNWSDAGNSLFSDSKVVSGSNLLETRKNMWGALFGGTPPRKRSAYLARRSGRILISPL